MKWSRSGPKQVPCTVQRSTVGAAQTSTVCNSDNIGSLHSMAFLRLEDTSIEFRAEWL